MSEFKPNELWKAIILYGLNQASYKMALGKVLIDQTTIGANEIPWHQLSKGFFIRLMGLFTASNEKLTIREE
jgi:hypothetical protein